MSSKTKIVVLHLKEVVYTAIFAVLGILLILLLIFMFLPDDKDKAAEETMKYTAGVYTSAASLKFFNLRLAANFVFIQTLQFRIKSGLLQHLLHLAVHGVRVRLGRQFFGADLAEVDPGQVQTVIFLQPIAFFHKYGHTQHKEGVLLRKFFRTVVA